MPVDVLAPNCVGPLVNTGYHGYLWLSWFVIYIERILKASVENNWTTEQHIFQASNYMIQNSCCSRISSGRGPCIKTNHLDSRETIDSHSKSSYEEIAWCHGRQALGIRRNKGLQALEIVLGLSTKDERNDMSFEYQGKCQVCGNEISITRTWTIWYSLKLYRHHPRCNIIRY